MRTKLIENTFSFKSSNNKNIIHGVIWMPKEEPKAILQIAHGMTEYIERYEEFAGYMTENGIMVVGNDHIGHGQSVESKEDWGYFAPKDGSSFVVEDMNHVTQMMKEKFPDIPYYLLGHSMGSFMTRRYLMNYGISLTGAIIVGTGNQPYPAIVSGKALINLVKMLKGENYRSQFVDKMMFGKYNKRVSQIRTQYDWLTNDPAIVDKYINDPACTFTFTLNGFYNLVDVIDYVCKKENINKIPKDLPILVTSGAEDPVGGYGKDVRTFYDNLVNAGIKNIDIKLYDGSRHELLNEVNRSQVYQDILAWIEKDKTGIR